VKKFQQGKNGIGTTVSGIKKAGRGRRGRSEEGTEERGRKGNKWRKHGGGTDQPSYERRNRRWSEDTKISNGFLK